MTEKQKQLFEENQGLVVFGMQLVEHKIQYQLSHEDAYSIALEALWKAACGFDERIGQFTTYGVNAIKTNLLHEACKVRRKKHVIDKHMPNIRYHKIMCPNDISTNSDQEYYMPILNMVYELLDPEEQSLLDQRFFEQKTYGEIAKARGVSGEAVRQRVARIIKKIRKKMPTYPERELL